MRRPSEIEQLIAPLFTGTPYELFGVIVSTGSTGAKQSIVRVFIDKVDKAEGVTIEDIATISRKISAYLDVESNASNAGAPLAGRYVLEVSSPGLDRTLFKPEHFAAQIGNTIQVSLCYPIENQKNFKGILQKIEGDVVYLEIVNGSHKTVQKLSFEQIDKARVIPAFKIGAKTG